MTNIPIKNKQTYQETKQQKQQTTKTNTQLYI